MMNLPWPVQRLFLALLGCMLAACANMQTVTDAPLDSGAARSFEAPFERVRAATLDAVRDLKLQPASVDDSADGSIILISRTPHGMSFGDVGRIFVEMSSSSATVVHVKYERRFALQFQGSGNRFARALFAKIEWSLAAAAVK